VRAREVLDEKYAVVRRLGAGACADVYEAENLLLGRRVALKVLRPEPGSERSRREAFLQQGRLAARLEHSHIAAVLDLGEVEQSAYIVVEMLSGEALQSAVRRSGSSLAAICDLLLQVLAALEHAHGEGIVHGALHPKNVFVVYPRPGVPWVKVTDFGLRCPLERGGAERGELAFLAPEAHEGAGDARSDVYSAAALLYTLLAGEPPRADSEVVEPLLQANARLPRTLLELIADGLRSDPERRVQSAAAFAERLAPFAVEVAPRASLAPEAMYAASLPSIRWMDGARPIASSWGSAGTSLALASANGSSIGPSCQNPLAARDSCVTESLLRNPRFPESGGSAGRHWRILKTRFKARPNTGAAWLLAVASVGAGIACALLAAWLQ
jgi:eukaryotic-like serine/threonine-protein kinase